MLANVMPVFYKRNAENINFNHLFDLHFYSIESEFEKYSREKWLSYILSIAVILVWAICTVSYLPSMSMYININS